MPDISAWVGSWIQDGVYLQNGMLSESKLAAWLAAIIPEIAFYQWSLQENGIGWQ